MIARLGAGAGRPLQAGDKRVPLRREAELAFMLARQTIARWRFDTQRLEQQLAGSPLPKDLALMLMEAERGLAQVQALVGRVQLFVRSRDLAIRFEAQEILVTVAELETRLAGIQRRSQQHRRSPAEVKAALLARVR